MNANMQNTHSKTSAPGGSLDRPRSVILTPRQLTILIGIASGEPHKAIAARLGLSVKTTEYYAGQIAAKFRIQAPCTALFTQAAIYLGLIQIDLRIVKSVSPNDKVSRPAAE